MNGFLDMKDALDERGQCGDSVSQHDEFKCFRAGVRFCKPTLHEAQ